VWVSGRRRVGDFRRPVLVVGANEEAAELTAVLDSHPELGFRVSGVVGARTDAGRTGLSGRWRGDHDDLFGALESTGSTGAIVCATALEPALLNVTVQRLLGAGVHVQLSSGVRGIQVQRLRPMPLAYEPLFYVEPATLERWQLVTKRVLDVALAMCVLAVTAPILAVTSVLVRLTSPGPVIFRQERIGLRGVPFTVYKFRTMRVGADEEHDLLRVLNAREGPLFKARVDPRVTRLGRYLRSTGIDELPQLWNVLNGTMSLVGPRPALPQEVAEFDAELRHRETVKPGITGLWQVEARDNPSFTEYRRFDLFYIDNWSVSLDLAILWSTVEATIARTVRGLRDADQDVHLAPAPEDEVQDTGSSVEPVALAPRLNGARFAPAYAGDGHAAAMSRSTRSSSSSTVRT
jgi:exopolysaccharide biosynthesis polyprenyl glycosylphosphotransferase